MVIQFQVTARNPCLVLFRHVLWFIIISLNVLDQSAELMDNHQRFHRNKDFIGEVLSFLSRPYPRSNAIRLCKVEMAATVRGFGHYKILGIQMYAAVSPCAVRFFSYCWSPWCLFATSTFLHNKNGLQIGGTSLWTFYIGLVWSPHSAHRLVFPC